MNEVTNKWFARPRPNSESTLRMFCFPYAGGSEVIFHQWSSQLPEVEIYSAKLPGRGKRIDEAPLTQMMPLVETLAEAMVPLLDMEFVLFGHSMGAILAFELAQHLGREYGLEAKRLIVSGRNAPHIPERKPPTYHLPEDEFLDELRRLNGTPKEVLECPEFLAIMMRVLRADFEMVQTYRYSQQSPLHCPVTAFGGVQDDDVWYEELEGWRQHTTGPFDIVMFPGDHFFINTDQQRVFREITQRLSPVATASERAGI